jgi:hypothetical protein
MRDGNEGKRHEAKQAYQPVLAEETHCPGNYEFYEITTFLCRHPIYSNRSISTITGVPFKLHFVTEPIQRTTFLPRV